MRRFTSRLLAVVAVIAGLTVGSSSLPAAAAPSAHHSATTSHSAKSQAKPGDWWG